MKNQYEVDGYYGASSTSCTIFVVEKFYGGRWYCVEDSCNVNFTPDVIDDGCDVEELYDTDTATSTKPIGSLDELYDFVTN